MRIVWPTEMIFGPHVEMNILVRSATWSGLRHWVRTLTPSEDKAAHQAAVPLAQTKLG